MIFNKKGDIIFEPADLLVIKILKLMHDGDWIKTIDYYIEHSCSENNKGQKTYSKDLVRILALYGFEMYAKAKDMTIKLPEPL